MDQRRRIPAACTSRLLLAGWAEPDGEGKLIRMASSAASRIDRSASVPEVGGLRVSDADRERAASELREHFALGRIDGDELDHRLGMSYAARTLEDLRALHADLPHLPASWTERQAARLKRTLAFDRGRGLARTVAVALLPFTACALVWLATGAAGGFWPAWVGLAGVVRLLRRGGLIPPSGGTGRRGS
jgi:Domain of unknown function (DUF1707)